MKPAPPPLRLVSEGPPNGGREIRALLYVCAALVLVALVALVWSSPAFAQAPRYEIQAIPVADAAALALVPCAAGVQNGENEERLQRDTQELYHCSELTVGGGFDWRLISEPGGSCVDGFTDGSIPYAASGACAEDVSLTWDGSLLAAPEVDTPKVTNTALNGDLTLRADSNVFVKFGINIPMRVKAGYVGLALAAVGGDTGLDPTAFLSMRGDGVRPYFNVRPPGGADGDTFVLDDSGNVGINTAAPGERLEVTGNVQVTGAVILTSVDGTAINNGALASAPTGVNVGDFYYNTTTKTPLWWDGVAWSP